MADVNQSTDFGRGLPFPALPPLMPGNLQQTGLRMLRAQERMLHGMANAARLEMKYGQELLSSRLTLLDWRGSTQPPLEHAAADLELTMTLMREVAEELRSGFAEAAKLLTEEAEPLVKEAVEQGKKTLEDVAHHVEDSAQMTMGTVKKAAAKAKEADPE